MENKITSAYSNCARYLLYCLLIFSPLARGLVHPWHKTVIFILSLCILAILLLERGITGKPAFYKTKFNVTIGILFLFFLIVFLFSISKPDSTEAAALFLSYLVIFYATVYCIRTRKDQRELIYVICAIGLLLIIIGFFKYLGFVLPPWDYDDLNASMQFITGTYGNHNHFAGFLEMVIPITLVLFLSRARRGLVWGALFSFVIVLVACHILTLSRGGWLSLFASLCFMTVVLLLQKDFKNKTLLILVFSSCIGIVFFVLSGSGLFERALSLSDEETVMEMSGRTIAWKGTIDVIKDYPFLGTGPGTFTTIFPKYQPPGIMGRFYHAHNDYLQFISELGIMFVPLICFILFSFFTIGFKKIDSNSRQISSFTLGAMTGIVAILVHSFVDFNLHIPANAILFTVLAAIVIGGPRAVIKN
ncbi:O-antigen ligase family protein [Thermodesulfobacteriota bacterium]